MELASHEVFTRLNIEISDAEFQIETWENRLADCYLFADGTLIKPGDRSVLRPAHLFSAKKDGRIASLTVVSMHPEDT